MASAAPEPIVALARARADARARRDWAEADRLRADIDAAGWKVVDEGLSFRLVPSHPADVEIAGRTRYGRSATVPSRLDAPAAGVATLVLLAGEDPNEVARSVAAAREHAPEGTELVVVGDAPSPAVEAALEAAVTAAGEADARPIDLVLTSEPLGRAASANAGIRRAGAPLVVLLGPGARPAGDVVTPLVRALDDPGVAVAGSCGIATRDLRHLEAAGPGGVDAVDPTCLAFRRADYLVRGPLDERLRTDEYLSLWWSLVLRDEGAGRPPRRAVCLDRLPLARGATVDDDAGERPRPASAAARDRATKRDYYRVLERFGGRADLIGATPARPGPASGDEDPVGAGP
jgi:hypothetical protein